MPEFETLEILGKSRATLAIHLSIRNLTHIRDTLTPYYGEDCPVVIAYRSTWPDELFIRTTLKDMAEEVRKAKITRTALIMVGKVFGHVEFPRQRPLQLRFQPCPAQCREKEEGQRLRARLFAVTLRVYGRARSADVA